MNSPREVVVELKSSFRGEHRPDKVWTQDGFYCVLAEEAIFRYPRENIEYVREEYRDPERALKTILMSQMPESQSRPSLWQTAKSKIKEFLRGWAPPSTS